MELFSMEIITALVTLTAMEIVLGIDNIIFISILVARLPEDKQPRARSTGIFLALFMRLGLLFSITWVMRLSEPIVTVLDYSFSGRDIILLLGGLFLIAKSTFEIHHKVEGSPEEEVKQRAATGSVAFIIGQIILLDVVFSLDSVITAVGMVKDIWVMVTAMVIAMIVMLMSAKGIGEFVERHPTVKILALSFLLLIGVMLMIEGMGQHVGKGYIYFAMAFSFVVELLNMRYRTRRAKA